MSPLLVFIQSYPKVAQAWKEDDEIITGALRSSVVECKLHVDDGLTSMPIHYGIAHDEISKLHCIASRNAIIISFPFHTNHFALQQRLDMRIE